MSEIPDKKQVEQSEEINAAALPEKANQKSIYNLLITILTVLILLVIIAWIRFTPSQNIAPQASPITQETAAVSPDANSKDAQTKDKDDEDDKEKRQQINEALADFMSANYKGWQIKGKSLVDDADNSATYDLDLTAANKDKIITVVVEKFQKENDDEYWLAYQPPQSQILEMQIKALKNKISDNQDDDKDSSDDNDGN